jgi:hypothetical protein
MNPERCRRNLNLGCLHPVACEIKVRGVFHLSNVNIVVFFTIYLIATSFGHTTIFKCHIFPRTYSTDNGSVVSRILVIIINNYSDRFIVNRVLLIWLLKLN